MLSVFGQQNAIPCINFPLILMKPFPAVQLIKRSKTVAAERKGRIMSIQKYVSAYESVLGYKGTYAKGID